MRYHFLSSFLFFSFRWLWLAPSDLFANVRNLWFLFSVKIEPPEIFSAKSVLGIKRMLQIKWKRPVLAPLSSSLKYTLRFRTINSAYWVSDAIKMFLLEIIIDKLFFDLESFFPIFYVKNRRQTIVSTFLPSFPFGPFRMDKCFTVGILHSEHRDILKSEKFTFAFHSGLCLDVLVARDSMAWPFPFLFFQPFMKLWYINYI